MADYISVADLKSRLGNKAMVQLTNPDNPRATDINEEVANDAIGDGRGIIDGYISKRTPLPLKHVSRFVKTLNKDLSVYYLKSKLNGDKSTSTEKLHDDAIKHLQEFADGDIDLGLDIPTIQDNTGQQATSNTAEITSQPRQNTRQSLGKVT